MLQSITIKQRLNILILLIIVTGSALILWQSLRLTQINDDFLLYQETAVRGEVSVLQISRDMNYCSRLTRSIMLGDDFDKNYKKLLQRIAAIKEHFSQLKLSVNSLNNDKKTILLNAINASEKDTMAFLNDSLRRMDELGKSDYSSQIRHEAWLDYRQTASPLANKARTSFKQLITLEKELNNEITALTENSIADTQLYSLLMMLLSIIIVVGFTLQVRGSILSPLRKLKDNIQHIEKHSDLQTRIDLNNNDELGEVASAFDRMLAKFQAILMQVQQSINQLSGASKLLSDTAKSTSNNLQEQQHETQHINKVMQTLSDTVHSIVGNTERANSAVNAATEESNEALAVVEQTTSTISRLEEDVSSTSAMIHKLEQDSDAIGSVVDVIRSIAEQTNLLALNAAIEAARAGEQGRGFAVVADEVRTLASRTQESTSEIQAMIERLQQGSSAAVKVMNTNQSQTSEVVESANNTASVIKTFNQRIHEITQINSEINQITQQQSQSAQDMSKAIALINQLSEVSAQNAEQNRMASHQLEELANILNRLIGQFKIG